MPTTVQIVNRYVNSDNVAGAAVVFDGAAIDALSPRTRANGQVVVATETLSDGDHVMHIVPDPTSTAPVGPAVAEGLGRRSHADVPSLDVTVAVRKGKITTKCAARSGAERLCLGAPTRFASSCSPSIFARRSRIRMTERGPTSRSSFCITHPEPPTSAGTLEWYINP